MDENNFSQTIILQPRDDVVTNNDSLSDFGLSNIQVDMDNDESKTEFVNSSQFLSSDYDRFSLADPLTNDSDSQFSLDQPSGQRWNWDFHEWN